MRRVVARGRTDVGRTRAGNEDSLLVCESVFAVADGMGGHLAGEVASVTALEPVEALDGEIFDDASQAVTALRDAVVTANDTVSRLAAENPQYRGMGTTLTAALLEGRRIHLAHVGDSRAYLLRDQQFSQVTDDHTLVQHLVDEGQITSQEAARHPQRSIITRAIGVSEEVEVDSITLELQPGDQILLCSDGLTGVVGDEEIAQVLSATEDPDEAVQSLIDEANDAGGPDNITVLLLRYEDSDNEPHGAPATRNDTVTISSRTDSAISDWAGDLGRFGALSRPGAAAGNTDDEQRRAGSMLGRAVAIAVGLSVIVGAVIGGGQFLLSRSYFVGLDDEGVAIFQGVDASLGPIDLYRVRERTELSMSDVQPWYLPTLEAGRPAPDLDDARRIVNGIPVREEADAEDEAEIDEDPAEDATDDADGRAGDLDDPDGV